jgi:3-hydroxyacyl-CoA dehydrogenase/3a,7a,12a-trihydroxy-5b-cholest-24-enoyl-CoA hydratase
VSIEDVRDGWSEVVDMELSSYPESTQQSTMDTLSMIEKSMPKKVSEDTSTSPLDAVGFASEPKCYSYSFKEVILYALGIGASTAKSDNLKFLYENDEDFSALPTFGVIPALSGLESLITGQIPGLDFDLSMVLHGEQFIEIFRPYATSGTLSQTFEIKDVLDKGSGMVLVLDAESRDQHDQLVCRNQCTIFVRGKGGFNGPRQSDHSVPVRKSPAREPDRTLSYQTSVDQAALYRLSADLNPLHIDPNFSAIGGFSKPILHGLCTYGIAARHVMEAFCANDPSLVRSVKARFSKPVYPGETVCTDMWLEDDIVLFKCRVLESGEECLSGGWVKLNKPKQKL